MNHTFFATAPKGIEKLLLEELQHLGVEKVKLGIGGVSFTGDLAMGYRVCLWSRLASRVLLQLNRFPVNTAEDLYAGVRSISWIEHLAPDGTFAVDCGTTNTVITHTHFGALKVKDAIVDQFRETAGIRPSVAIVRPQIRLNLYLQGRQATLSLDFAGESLHRRGYRQESVIAPLKENLASAILVQADWPELARTGAPLVDPMCGSGTLPIEAALMAYDIAPGLLRHYYGFMGWRGHEPRVWESLLMEAQERKVASTRRTLEIVGYDADPSAVRFAWRNVEAAGLNGRVHIERRTLAEARPIGKQAGLFVINPPYGERLEDEGLPRLYAGIGEVLRRHFPAWQAAIFTGNPDLLHRLRLKSAQSYAFYNGAIPCKLLVTSMAGEEVTGEDKRVVASSLPLSRSGQQQGAVAIPVAQVEMFANRLRKNLKHLGRWARQQEVFCYRVYDRDLPEFAVAIDLYQGEGRWVQIQEYQAPAEIDPVKAEARVQAVLAALPEILELAPEHVYLKIRQRQRGLNQYERIDETGEFHIAKEGPCRFLVNFTDYLDTGLFLDHRLTRKMIMQLAAGKRFLNLFAYTGTATIYAALGGATSTMTIDMSNTYLDWTARNFVLNGIAEGEQHQLIQADCLVWMEEVSRGAIRPCYDLIFVDPPTFSNSKRMTETFDVQRDHVEMLRNVAKLLSPEGIIIFSTNRQGFKLD